MLKQSVAAWVAMVALAGVGTAQDAVSSAPTAKASTETFLKEQDGRLLFGNEKVELVLNGASGYFLDIRNKKTGLSHKALGTGSWPYAMTLGQDGWPDLLEVSMPAEGNGVQTMRHELLPPQDGAQTLRMMYPDLVTSAGNGTGVQLTVAITLGRDDEHFLIRARVANNSRYRVTKLVCGGSDLVAADSREAETLAVPTWSSGQVWPNPHAHFAQRATFGYPLFGTHCGLDCGWLDLYGPAGGIGVGYLNRQGMSMLFNVQQASQGLTVNWQMFTLPGLGMGSVGCVCGLEPGKTFETDAWILAPHQGDWHRMADLYHQEYDKAFRDDYLTWAQTSPAVKQMDFYMLTSLDLKTFADVPEGVRRYAEAVGLHPENLGMLLWGSSRHFPRHMPDHLPCKESLGGDAGAKAMCRMLRDMGMTAILFYGHLYYNHPKAADYVAEADTGCDRTSVPPPEFGNLACPDTPAWQRLWTEKYAPGYAALGGGGITLDQGPTQYIVCPRDDHPHGTDSVQRLCAHVNGIDRIIRGMRGAFNGTGMVATEVGSDIQVRHVDLWQASGMGFYSPGGLPRTEIVRYTMPYRTAIYGSDDPSQMTPEVVNEALLNGFVLGLGVQVRAETMVDGEGKAPLKAALRRYADLRRSMRAEKAPGYPEGFRDADGLTVSNPGISARAYRGDSGITVVYCANEAAKSTITVDAAALGFANGPRKDIEVNLPEHGAGYAVLPF